VSHNLLLVGISQRSIVWVSQRNVRRGSIIPRDSTALLTVNGDAVEIPSATTHEHNFHLLLDGSVAELIVDRRHAVTTRIYRKPDGPLRLKPGDKILLL
jgi:hypothetical protein